MTTARTVRLLGVIAVLTAAGCVDRKFVIESNVPNAQVYIDNRSVGAAPAYSGFEYYGYYTIKIVHPGYETITKRVHVTAPWYAYPPIDFLAEAVWPFRIRDTRRYYFELQEATQARTDDILNAADALRARGLTLPLPERPAVPPTRPTPVPPGPIIGPPVAPATGPVVPGPVVPSPAVPGPAVPGPAVPGPAPSPAPGVVPSVQPG